jgi:hypothetical protein
MSLGHAVSTIGGGPNGECGRRTVRIERIVGQTIVPVGRGLQPQDARSRHEGFSEAGSRSCATLVETWLRVHQPDDGVGPLWDR